MRLLKVSHHLNDEHDTEEYRILEDMCIYTTICGWILEFDQQGLQLRIRYNI